MDKRESSTIEAAYETFLLDMRAQRFTQSTIDFYRYRLTAFIAWGNAHRANTLADITPTLLRSYLVHLQDRELADYSQHAAARAIRAFLNFCVREELLPLSPMHKVKMPKVDKRILPALSVADVKKLVKACKSERDKAIVLFLLDTGVRAAEFVRLNIADMDTDSGEIRVKQGKGRKDRPVYLGAKALRQLTRYLSRRKQRKSTDPLFISEYQQERLTKSGLNQLLRRIGKRAGVTECKPHTFRRTFALWSLRAGMNIYVLQRLMGHKDITVLRQYLALVDEDARQAHESFGPVDNNL